MSITRKDYLAPATLLPDGKLDAAANMARHRAYYAQYVNESTIAAVVRAIGAERLRASTDPHLNDIPLGEWDALTSRLPHSRRWDELGDYPTVAGLGCIAKEAARQWLEAERG